MKPRPAGIALLLLVLGAAAATTARAAADSGNDDWDDDWNGAPPGLVWSGFLEGAVGTRVDGGAEPTHATLGEIRARAETLWARDRLLLSFKGDALHDEALGRSDLLVRELSLQFPIGEATDIKAGRQVLTWGTGDLLFLNDLFPKDFDSFFAGREDDYLKAPANALRVTAYRDLVNIDLVWMPLFKPDVYLDGSRFSFFNPASGEIEAPDPTLHAVTPDKSLGNGEIALRLFKRVESVEYALYGYRGYFKQPTALDNQGRLTFAPLSSLGASIRKPWGAGLFNAEVAWYESRDDNSGRDPDVPNSQARWLVGYERELITNLTGGIQYYGERIQHHAGLRAAAPEGLPIPDKWRSVITARLTYRALRDNLVMGMFVFVSPSDRDYHLRPNVTYRLSDAWQLAGGLNLFGGQQDHTFFGQLEDNSNLYFRIRRYY